MVHQCPSGVGGTNWGRWRAREKPSLGIWAQALGFHIGHSKAMFGDPQMVCLRLARCQALPMHAPAEPPRNENQCLRRYSDAAPGVLGGDSSPNITSQWLKCLAHITCAHGQAFVPIHQPAVLAWHHT